MNSTSMDNGKSPSGPYANGASRLTNGGPGTLDNNMINVQPPRREDLQPAYAQTLKGESEDVGSHGWYGSMSTFSQISTHPDAILRPVQ
jgi:erythrocyte band 7 integral membrane protein